MNRRTKDLVAAVPQKYPKVDRGHENAEEAKKQEKLYEEACCEAKDKACEHKKEHCCKK